MTSLEARKLVSYLSTGQSPRPSRGRSPKSSPGKAAAGDSTFGTPFGEHQRRQRQASLEYPEAQDGSAQRDTSSSAEAQAQAQAEAVAEAEAEAEVDVEGGGRSGDGAASAAEVPWRASQVPAGGARESVGAPETQRWSEPRASFLPEGLLSDLLPDLPVVMLDMPTPAAFSASAGAATASVPDFSAWGSAGLARASAASDFAVGFIPSSVASSFLVGLGDGGNGATTMPPGPPGSFDADGSHV
jgi:hypothetical protein